MDNFSVQSKTYLREWSPAIVIRGVSKREKTQENGGSGVFHVPSQRRTKESKGREGNSLTMGRLVPWKVVIVCPLLPFSR